MSAEHNVVAVTVISTIDGCPEEIFFIPSARQNDPVLVKLHTWSCNKNDEIANIHELHDLTGWNIIAPEFRGPNLVGNPRAKQACASKLAKQDILDAVHTIMKQYALTSQQIFLFGGSGGGHMALMMAAYAPTFWTAIAAWCPVTDLNDKGIWAQCTDIGRDHAAFHEHVLACCGRNARARSPISHIDEIARATVYLFHGNKDISVPFLAHSETFYHTLIRKHPSAEVYLQIFNGGHEIHNAETLAVFKRYLPIEDNSTLENLSG